MRFQVALLSLLLLPACQLSAAFEVENFHCDDGRCPSGQECGADLICRKPAVLDDGGVPAPDAAAPTGPCNKASLMADDFAAATAGAQWVQWSSGSGTSISRASGRLRIDVPANHSQTAYAGYYSRRYFDLTDSSVGMKITHMVNPASEAEAYISLYSVDGDWVSWTQGGGSYYLDSQAVGEQRQRIIKLYDAADVYWRLREAAGTLYFEASSDGTSWREVDSRPTPFDVTRVDVEFAAGVWQSESSPGYFEIEDLNGGVPSGRYCKVDTLSDDFEDGFRGEDWANSYGDQGCNVDEQGGVLVGTPATPTSAEGYCAYQTSTAYDLRDSHATIEVTEMLGATPPTIAFFKLAEEKNGHGVELAVEGGQLDCRLWKDGGRSSLGSVPWNASLHRFWQLSESAGSIHWEVSPDGVGWTTLCSTPTSGVDIDDLAVIIGVGTPAATSSTATGSFSVEGLNF